MNDIIEINSNAFATTETAPLDLKVHGKPIGWTWIFAGPAHPKAIAERDRAAREALRVRRDQEQARANGRKWEASEDNLDAAKAESVAMVVGRLVDWSPIKLDGKLLPFSAEAATTLLADPKNLVLLSQSVEFLADVSSFIPRCD